MWINQDAVFSLGDFDKGSLASYSLKFPGNGVYVFVIEGKVELDGELIGRRDAAGVYDTEKLELTLKEDSKILLIEIPME